ncbi:MAG: hypothetical protein V1697_00555 [Candidatus Levyibacteriota bacterium]
MNLTSFFQNKKFLIGSLIALFFIVALIVIFVISSLFKTVDEQPLINTDEFVSPTTMPVITTKIIQNIEKEIRENIEAAIPSENINIYEPRLYEDWAIVTIEPKDHITDAANLLLHKEENQWKIILGPGTFFDEESLIEVSAPIYLFDEINRMSIPAPESAL